MTPRETIAAMALQGILASGNKDTLETIVTDSVIAADMLLNALKESEHTLTQKLPTGLVKAFL